MAAVRIAASTRSRASAAGEGDGKTGSSSKKQDSQVTMRLSEGAAGQHFAQREPEQPLHTTMSTETSAQAQQR